MHLIIHLYISFYLNSIINFDVQSLIKFKCRELNCLYHQQYFKKLLHFNNYHIKPKKVNSITNQNK